MDEPGACVALVDDNPFDNEYATIILRKAGYAGAVHTFLSGPDMLEAAGDGPGRRGGGS